MLIIVLCTFIAMHLLGWTTLIAMEDTCWVLFMIHFVSHCVFHFATVSRHKANMIKGQLRCKTRHHCVRGTKQCS